MVLWPLRQRRSFTIFLNETYPQRIPQTKCTSFLFFPDSSQRRRRLNKKKSSLATVFFKKKRILQSNTCSPAFHVAAKVHAGAPNNVCNVWHNLKKKTRLKKHQQYISRPYSDTYANKTLVIQIHAPLDQETPKRFFSFLDKQSTKFFNSLHQLDTRHASVLSSPA